MVNKTRHCWFHTRENGKRSLAVKSGAFHTWSTDYIANPGGPGYPVAIVESLVDDEIGAVYIVFANDVCFGAKPWFSPE